MWGTGNYDAVAEKIAEAGEAAGRAAGVEPGHGRARRGLRHRQRHDPGGASWRARVTGLDFVARPARDRARVRAPTPWSRSTGSRATPRTCRSRTTASTASSRCFGHMFAPDHEAHGATRCKRVCRPGGRIAIAAGRPRARSGRCSSASGRSQPPPPEGFQPPTLWGTEEHVRELLGDGARVRAPRGRVGRRSPPRPTPSSWRTASGRCSRPGSGSATSRCTTTYLGWLHEVNEADDGRLRFRGEYLISSSTPRARPARARRSPRARGPRRGRRR